LSTLYGRQTLHLIQIIDTTKRPHGLFCYTLAIYPQMLLDGDIVS